MGLPTPAPPTRRGTKRWTAALLLAGAVLCELAWPRVAPAAGRELSVVTGRVVGVTDGDTLTILDRTLQQHRIRLGGVDTPERGQPYGKVAKSNLSALAFGREATADCGKADRWGRLVCKVRVDGRDVGLGQVESGLGWHYKKYEREQSPADREAYARAEDAARAARRGLWRDPAPVAPWDWRRPRRARFGSWLPRIDRSDSARGDAAR